MYYIVYLSMRNYSWEETLIDILERRLMGMLERMGVSGSGIETVDEWHFLTLL